MCRADTKRLHSQAAASVLLAVALCAADQPRLIAQGAAAATIKAAFLYNFAKFTQWPAAALAPGQRLTLCVVGDRSVADALEMTIKGRLVEGHELSAQSSTWMARCSHVTCCMWTAAMASVPRNSSTPCAECPYSA